MTDSKPSQAFQDIQNAEVITPLNIVKDMVDLLPTDVFNPDTKFLDPAVKSGRFLAEIYRRLFDSPLLSHMTETNRRQHILTNQLYGLATSPAAATIVRKQLYDDPLEIGNIVYSTGKVTKELVQGAFNIMKFDVVIGNPPYNNDIYLDFVTLGHRLSSQYTVMITPAKWQAKGGKKNEDFRKNIVPYMSKIMYYPCCYDVFNIAEPDGISYYLKEQGSEVITTSEPCFICRFLLYLTWIVILVRIIERSYSMRYEDLIFKIPVESPTYREDSEFIIRQMTAILDARRAIGDNKIIINTNLIKGLPLENINKIAGPMIEAWAGEVFAGIRDDYYNEYKLINVEAQERLGMADIILQFRKSGRVLTGNVDVKATADDIPNSGKGPNITSFSRIRTAYVADPDYMFIILSIKHRVYSERNRKTGLVDGIMEVVDYNAYDLKFISDADINYNPALGTGQIQIKDIHYVTYQYRTTWEMCQLLDQKYLHSSRRSIDDFYREARKNKWIKN